MNIVIDKANVLRFLSESDEKIAECTRLIRNGINLIFNFTAKDITQEEKEKIFDWVKVLSDNGEDSNVFFLKILDYENLKTNFITNDLKSMLESYAHLEECKNLDKRPYRYAFLLEDKKIVKHVKEKGNALMGGVGEECDLILSLRLEGTERLAHKIDSWNNYCPKLPISDIILCDNYYFFSKKLYEEDDNELIKALCRRPYKSPVNIVIIIKGEKRKDETPPVDPNIDLKEEQKKLESMVRKLTSSKSTVTIVKSRETHDRQVITNYFRINTGKSFHLHDKSDRRNILTEIKTHANKANEVISDDLIEEYKNIVDKNKSEAIFSVKEVKEKDSENKTMEGDSLEDKIKCRFFE